MSLSEEHLSRGFVMYGKDYYKLPLTDEGMALI